MKAFLITMMAFVGSGHGSGLRFADTRVPTQKVPNPCVSLTGTTCVFPFSYKGVTYDKCTFADSPQDAWCATAVDTLGNVITNMWENCNLSSGCQAEAATGSTGSAGGSNTGSTGSTGGSNTGSTGSTGGSNTGSTGSTGGSNTGSTGSTGGSNTGSTGSTGGSNTGSTSCSTTSGPDSGKTCVFPFKYNNIVYTECTNVQLGSPWCSTEVDADGNFVLSKWGQCSSSCPGASSSSGVCTTSSGPAAGQPCVFPFTFNGVSYSSCADWIYPSDPQPSGTTWCSTMVDAAGAHVNNQGNYGFCPSDAACSLASPKTPRSRIINFGRQNPPQ